MLTEQTVISHIGVLEDGQLQIRRSRRIYDGTTMLAEQYHRHVVEPGQPLNQEDARVRVVAQVLWTPEVIQAFIQAKAARRNP